MTIREAVLAFVALDVPTKTIDLELINSNLDGTMEYSAVVEIQTARTAANVLSYLLMIDRFSEGDLTIDYDTAGVLKRLLFLAGKYGFDDLVPDSIPKIRNKSYIW